MGPPLCITNRTIRKSLHQILTQMLNFLRSMLQVKHLSGSQMVALSLLSCICLGFVFLIFSFNSRQVCLLAYGPPLKKWKTCPLWTDMAPPVQSLLYLQYHCTNPTGDIAPIWGLSLTMQRVPRFQSHASLTRHPWAVDNLCNPGMTSLLSCNLQCFDRSPTNVQGVC